MNERKRDMFIDAKKMKEIANNINTNKRQKAEAMVNNEWNNFIAPRILTAAKEGRYSTSYFWDHSCPAEWDIDTEYFVDALKKKIVLLGFNAEIETTVLMGEIIKITAYINWRDET